MPNPGTANNPGGINSFSGPMGEKEPAYGQIERAKQLKSAAPVAPSPGIGAPEQAKRRAVSGGGAVPAQPSPPHPEAGQMVQAEQQQQQFWLALLNDPGSSPLTRQYAEQALGAAS